VSVYEIQSWATGELIRVCEHVDSQQAEMCAIRVAVNTGRTVEIVEVAS
jgi:hypothetical protein